jgi:hypothetical protein
VPSNKIWNRLAKDFVKFLEAQFILSIVVTWQRSTFTPKKGVVQLVLNRWSSKHTTYDALNMFVLI